MEAIQPKRLDWWIIGNRGEKKMNKRLISIAVGTIVALFVSGTLLAQGGEKPVFVPVELYACQYNEGKGPADLDAATAAWTEYSDQNNVDSYAAWTLEKHYFGQEQDFDVLWLGAWKNANEMGTGTDNYLATGGALEAGFMSVVTCAAHVNLASVNPVPPPGGQTPETGVLTVSNCTVKEGVRNSDLAAAMDHWGQALKDAGIEVGIYHWYPVFGGGDDEFTFKWVESYANHTALGKAYEIMGNGGLYLKNRELFNDLLDCDSARVYNAKNRRKAQLR